MLMTCPNRIVCPTAEFLGDDTPFANLSTERDDEILYPVINFGGGQTPPVLGCGNASNTAIGVCQMRSIEDATICADNQQLSNLAASRLCPSPTPPPPPPITGWPPPPATPDAPVVNNVFSQIPRINPTVFYNQAVGFDYKCPDGLTFTYVVEAGLFAAFDQATANAKAQSYAEQKAAKYHICLDDLTPNVCWGQAYSSTAEVFGGTAPINVSIVSGALPPGFVMTQATDSRSFTVSFGGGFSSVPGPYTFTIRATDALGFFMQKTYTISILGISNARTLPPITAGVFYSVNLLGIGGTPSYSFVNSIGTPPAGLTLASNGTISGTPTGTLPVIHGVTVTDGTGRSCGVLLTWTKTTAPSCTALFSAPAWYAFHSTPPPINGSASCSGSGNTFSLFAQSNSGSVMASADLGFGQTGQGGHNTADIAVTGPLPMTCSLTLTCTVPAVGSGHGGGAYQLIGVYADTSTVLLLNNNFVSGTNNYPFVIGTGIVGLRMWNDISATNDTTSVNGTFGP